MSFDPTTAKPADDNSFDPSTAKVFDPSSAKTEPPGVLSSIAKAAQLLTSPVTSKIVSAGKLGLGAAEQPAAGLYGLGSQAAAGLGALWDSVIKRGGDAVAGRSFGDRFSEEYNKITNKLATAYHPITEEGAAMTDAGSRIISSAVQALGDSMYKGVRAGEKIFTGKQSDTGDKLAAGTGAIAQAITTLGMIAAVPGGKEMPKAPIELTGNVLTDFAAKYPRTMRRMDASNVGDAPIAKARAENPSAHFGRIVEDAVNKELGISDPGRDVPLTLGDKIKMVVQKHAALSKEPIPLNDQVQYANSIVDKIFELQKHADQLEVESRPKGLPAPYVIAEPIVVDTKGVATIGQPFTMKDIAEYYGTTVDEKGAAGKQMQDALDRLNAASAKFDRRGRQRGAFDVGELDKNVEALKHLGDGVTQYAAAGLVQPPEFLRALHPEKDAVVNMYRPYKRGEDTSLKPGAYVSNQPAWIRNQTANGRDLMLDKILLDHLVEVHPHSYIYAPPGTDLGPMIHTRNADGTAMTFQDLAPVQVGRTPLKGQDTAQTHMPTQTLMMALDRNRAIEPKQSGRLEAIQQSIKEYGIKQPVTVTISKPDQMGYVTDGNHRVLAASNLQMTDVPVKFEKTDVPFTAEQKAKARSMKELGLDESKIPDRVPTTEDIVARNELRKLLATPGRLQRGAFDPTGLEKNLTTAEKVAQKAAGSGWAVKNQPEVAAYVANVMKQNELAVEASRKAFGKDVVAKARRAFYAHDYDIRKDLTKAGPAGEVAHDRMVVQNGATMAAKVQMDKVNKDIFDKFGHEDRKTLDEVTRLRRIIQIDKYKGIGTVRHEGGITGPMAAARLAQLQNSLGDKFHAINDASTSIFEEQKILLDKLRDNGLISDELHRKLYNLDYTRTEYLDIVDPAIPIASHVRNMPTSIRSSGIPELGRGKMTAVNIDAQALLMEDMARVENRIFKNNTLLAVRDLAIQNPENGIVRLPGKQDIVTNKNGDQQIRHTPEGWTTIGVRVNGKQEFMQMKDDYAEQFVARPEAMPEWLAVTFRTVSGTSLLKATSTGMNPAFLIAGIPMDIFHTWVAGTDVYSPHLPVYLTQIGKDLTATAKDAFTKTGAWQDAMSEGIGSSYLTHESRSLTDPNKSVKSQLLPRLAKTRETLSYLNDVSDMWIRLAYRNRLISSGIEPWRATAMARDRLDYFQGGMITKAFDTFIPYANVTVQAAGKAIEAAARNPMDMAIKMGWITGAAASVTLANMVASPETNKNISTMDKVRNWNITFGDQFYTLDQNGNKRYMYIPIRLDQVVMPVNAAVVGGLEKAQYGKLPNGLVGNAIGQVSPVGSALPIPTVDAIASYVSNYDTFTDSQIYKGPKVKPEDEVRTFGEGKATSPAMQMIGQATGMSPMRLETAAGKLINTNNFYIQAMGGAYKLLFAGADPRDQAASTTMMLQNVPGLRSIVKLTTPATSLIDDLQQAEQEAGSVKAQALHGLNDLIFQQEHNQNGVTLKTIETYINNQPPELRQKLADHTKYTVTVNKIMDTYKASDEIPTRSWWIASSKAPGEVRAQAFYDQWVSASPSGRQRMLSIANSLQNNGVGYLSPDFQRAFAAERKMLGDEHR